MQEVRSGPSDPVTAVAPYEHGFGLGSPSAGESIGFTVDWGDGSPSGHVSVAGPIEPGSTPPGDWSHTYATPGTYTWHSTGFRVVLVAISPTEGNLPCTLPINDTGTITITVRGGAGAVPRSQGGSTGAPGAGSASAGAFGSPAAGFGSETSGSGGDEPASGSTTVAAGRTQPAGDGGFPALVLVLLGAVGLGAAGLLLGRRAGLFAGLQVPAEQRLKASDVAGKGVEYIQNVHAEVSDTKAAHDAEISRRREELIQHYLPTVGGNQEMAEVLADNDLSQYGSNAPMVNDVGQDALWDAPTKGVRDTWNSVTRWWNTTFGPKP